MLSLSRLFTVKTLLTLANLFPIGKLEAFAARARIVHIDIDPAEINKNKSAHISLCANTKPAISILNKMLNERPVPAEQVALPLPLPWILGYKFCLSAP